MPVILDAGPGCRMSGFDVLFGSSEMGCWFGNARLFRRTDRFPGFSSERPSGLISKTQSIRHNPGNGIMNLFLLRKPHLVFCGMDIHIHLIIGNMDKKDRHRKLPLHQSAMIPFEQGMLDDPVTDNPAVYIDVYPPGCTARDPGRRHPAGNGKTISV